MAVALIAILGYYFINNQADPIAQTDKISVVYSVEKRQAISSCQNCSINKFFLYKFDPSTGANVKFYSHAQNQNTVEKSTWGASYAGALNNDFIQVARRVTARDGDNIVIDSTGKTVMTGLELAQPIMSPDGRFVAFRQYTKDYDLGNVDLGIEDLSTKETKIYDVSAMASKRSDRYSNSLFPLVWSTDSKTLFLQEYLTAEIEGRNLGFTIYKLNISTGDITPYYTPRMLEYNSANISPVNSRVVGNIAKSGEGYASDTPPSTIEYMDIDKNITKTLVECPSSLCTGLISNTGDKFAYIELNSFSNEAVSEGQIYVADIDNPSGKVLVDIGVSVVAWSPGDRYLVYIKDYSGRSSNVRDFKIYDTIAQKAVDLPIKVNNSTQGWIDFIGFIKG